MVENTHEVDTSDTKTSKYEASLSLVKVGYGTLTGIVALDLGLRFAGINQLAEEFTVTLYTTWFGATTGLIGWLLGKNGK